MATGEIRNVELMSVGTWDASTGRSTIVPDDFIAAAQAYADHLVDRPALKIGHEDPRFNGPEFDGEPAMGWIENIRPSPDGQKLLGDLVGIPSSLMGIIPAAFRRRSIEMSFGVRTAAGKVYRCVVTGLALLGATRPAVKNLADVVALYAGLVAARSGSFTITDTGDVPPLITLATNADGGRTTTDQGGPPVAVDRKKLREALGLPPTASKKEVQDALAKSLGASFAADYDEPDEPEVAPVVPPAAPAVPVPPAPAAQPPVAAPAAAPAAPATPAAAPVAAAGATGTSHPAGAVLIDANTLAELQAGATAGVRAAESVDKNRRDEIIRVASQQGRLHPKSVATFRAQLDTNETGTVAILAAMEPMVNIQFAGSDLAAAAAVSETDLAELAKSAMAQLYGGTI